MRRSSITRIAQDLAAVMTALARRAENRADRARMETANAVESRIRDILPEAEIVLSGAGNRLLLNVADENLAARERGGLNLAPDRPISDAIESLRRSQNGIG